MNRPQQEATRALLHAELAWLEAYGWTRVYPGTRLTHPKMPDTLADYSVRDAVALTRADLLRYSSLARSVRC